jgi:hypothetical protein
MTKTADYDWDDGDTVSRERRYSKPDFQHSRQRLLWLTISCPGGCWRQSRLQTADPAASSKLFARTRGKRT